MQVNSQSHVASNVSDSQRRELFIRDDDEISRIGATEQSFAGNHNPDFDSSMLASQRGLDQNGLNRSTMTSNRNSQFVNNQSQKNLLNFESRLQNDLQQTTNSLISHLRDHSILSNENIPLMKPIENCLKECLAKMQTLKIPDNKNYFAMSLKMFFMSLTEDELEFVCHSYIHNWINLELKRSNRQLTKYQVEDKLAYINQNKTNMSIITDRAGMPKTPRDKSRQSMMIQTPNNKSIPRYMAPTIGGIQKKKDEVDPTGIVDIQNNLRDGRNSAAKMNRSSSNQSILGQSRMSKSNVKNWNPTSIRDKSLDASFLKGAPLPKGEEGHENSQMESSRAGNKSISREGETALVNRLFSQGAQKRALKKQFYEEEKDRRETAKCTFAPNASRKSNFQSNQMTISLQTGVGGKETEVSRISNNASGFADQLEKGTAYSTGKERVQASGQRSARRNFTGKTPIPEDPEIMNQGKENFEPKSATKKQQAELTDYLAYQGVKNLKAEQLQKTKEKQELEKCTFAPKIINYRNTQSTGNLNKRQIDKTVYEKVKNNIEMKDCTFKPSVSKKSQKLTQDRSTKDLQILKEKRQQEKAKKLMQEKDAKEMGECTFTPQLKKKTVFGPKVTQQVTESESKLKLSKNQSVESAYGSARKEDPIRIQDGSRNSTAAKESYGMSGSKENSRDNRPRRLAAQRSSQGLKNMGGGLRTHQSSTSGGGFENETPTSKQETDMQYGQSKMFE